MITARGTGLLAAALIALGAGFAFGYPDLGLLGTAGLVAVGFAAAYATWRPALRVARTAQPDRVARGEACTVTLTVSNDSRLRAATLIAEDHCGARRIPVPLVRLRPRRDTEVSYPVPTERRGVVRIGPLWVTRADPLGLAALSRSHGETVLVWVYPRILPLSAVPAGVARSLDGRIDRVPHGSITFDTLREYVIGDELRRVHWRTSARVGQLMVREHLDTSLPRIVVLLDDRAASYPDAAGGVAETFESACEAAASVVAAAVRAELPVALHLVAGTGSGSAADAARQREGLADATGAAGGPRAGTGTGAGLRRRLRTGRGPLASVIRRLEWAGTATGSTSGGPVLAEAHARQPASVDTGGRRAETARPFLDLLAEAGLVACAGNDRPVLRTAVDRLRNSRAGDTLIYLTGHGGRAGLGEVASLRGRYPSLLATVFVGRAHGGAGAGAGGTVTTAAGLPRADGLLVLDARDSEDFAAEWEGARGW